VVRNAPEKDKFDDLLKRIEKLEALVSTATPRTPDVTMKDVLKMFEIFDTRLSRFGDHLHYYAKSLEDIKAADADRIETTFERIKHIEAFLWPNLVADSDRVYEILGTQSVPAEENPLDSRKAFPPEKPSEGSNEFNERLRRSRWPYGKLPSER
jgi:hypothetical protein